MQKYIKPLLTVLKQGVLRRMPWYPKAIFAQYSRTAYLGSNGVRKQYEALLLCISGCLAECKFNDVKVAGYSGLLLSVPTVLYEIVAYVVPGLTRSERQLLAPIIFGSSILFYVG